MSFVRVGIHAVWATKDRAPVFASGLQTTLFRHIWKNAGEKAIRIDSIGGYVDHVHGLFSLGAGQTVSGTIQLIKGESAFWINSRKLCKDRFEWQDEYYAVSVGESELDAERAYIRNQERHHVLSLFSTGGMNF
jgi:REP element-mobilizing transposase RayT